MIPDVLHLRGGGSSLLLDLRDDGLPVVVHWGSDLGRRSDDDLVGVADAVAPPVARATLDVPVPCRLLPARADGWRGRPAVSGHRQVGGDGADTGWSPSFRLQSVDSATSIDGVGESNGVDLVAEDPSAGLRIALALRLDDSGVLRSVTTLTNIGEGDYVLDHLASLVLPLSEQAIEVLDLTGRWCRERSPQRHPLAYGTWLRESRRGRTGHDSSLVLAVGEPGFGNRHGQVSAIHLGWSADSALWAERLPDGHATFGAAELLAAGEVVLAPGRSHTTPTGYAVYSDHGLDGISEAFHRFLRARPGHPSRPRPVVLNTWEAVYFDHDLDRLVALADAAAEVGVERFVLDDGWFRHRRDDTAGLGDWYVDEEVWPQGLTPLIEAVRARGMEFGLWVEPEMVNPDSDLYRAHPEWTLHAADRVPPPWRNQQVLDLARPEVADYLLERLDALLTDNDIAYLKWDHNRDLVEPGHRGSAALGAHTRAVYALLDELRRRHPSVEIESCSSGGARVDLGILERTDRVWASDTNDALERVSIGRWTELLLPPELVGAHIGPPRSHTTGRVHDLGFRFAVALFGHFGLEWDIASLDAPERCALSSGIAYYKQVRPLLHTGRLVTGDLPTESGAALRGVVDEAAEHGLFSYLQLSTAVRETPAPVHLPGLDDDRRYRVRPVAPAGAPRAGALADPPWYTAGSVELPGRVLRLLGLPLPVLQPEQALLLEVEALS